MAIKKRGEWGSIELESDRIGSFKQAKADGVNGHCRIHFLGGDSSKSHH